MRAESDDTPGVYSSEHLDLHRLFSRAGSSEQLLSLCNIIYKYEVNGVCLTCVSPQGLIFVVDSNDRERVAESADELAKMVRTDRKQSCYTHWSVVLIDDVISHMTLSLCRSRRTS